MRLLTAKKLMSDIAHGMFEKRYFQVLARYFYNALHPFIRSLADEEQREVMDMLFAWAGMKPTLRSTHRTLSTDELLCMAKGEIDRYWRAYCHAPGTFCIAAGRAAGRNPGEQDLARGDSWTPGDELCLSLRPPF